jgi:hypothetical protein
LAAAGQVLLGDEVALAAHRGDHLGQVRGLAAPHVEDVLAAEAVERLDDGGTVQLAQEGPHPLDRAGDEGLGRISAGKPARYIFEPPGQTVRIVDDHDPRLLQPPPELDGGVEAVALGAAYMGVVAEERPRRSR